MTKQSRFNLLDFDRDCYASLHSARNDVSFWLDSSGGPPHLCKQSMIGSNPKYYLSGSLNEVTQEDCEAGTITFYKENCFNILEEKINEEKHNKDGIFVGYISYDLFSPHTSHLTPHYPDFFFAYFPHIIARSVSDKAIAKRYEIASPAPSAPPRNDILCSNMTDTEYLEKVKLIKEEIKNGNVYQVNLTREYAVESDELDELELYLRLREVSPNPYGCFFRTPFITMLSSSPEEFLFIKDGYIRTRPIKGTLPRNISEIDEKNKAENIMIVDLERNDLGRICKPGTIKVSKLLELESYAHLNHMVSTVEGELKKNIKVKEIFEAMFPSGSVTGAPKIAAMKIIDKVEPTKRGAYTGSFGYIKTDGTMNFNILIRTIFIKKQEAERHRSREKITFNVGGGIVADSDPQSELEEIKLKAKGIISALGINELCMLS